MKKFQFSLEKVKEVKETEEKLIMREFAVAQKDLYLIKQKKEELEERKQTQWNKQNSLQATAVVRAEIMNSINYLNSLESEINTINTGIKSLESKLERIRNRLLLKAKERKTLEKLKEIKLLEYNKNRKKQEQLFIDEISTQTYLKKGRGLNV